MLYLVIKHVGGKEFGVNVDGTHEPHLSRSELFAREEAEKLAAEIGGVVLSEERAFPQDWQDDD